MDMKKGLRWARPSEAGDEVDGSGRWPRSFAGSGPGRDGASRGDAPVGFIVPAGSIVWELEVAKGVAG